MFQRVELIQVILLEIDCAIFDTNLHEFLFSVHKLNSIAHLNIIFIFTGQIQDQVEKITAEQLEEATVHLCL